MKLKSLLFLLLSAILASNGLIAQDIPKTRQIIIETAKDITKAHVLVLKANNPIKSSKRYYSSYYKESIFKTQGSYVGHLLHGPYEIFHADHSLKVQGKHQYGLPHGQWNSWNKTGHLQSITHWRNGYKHGVFKSYNDKGQILQRGKYKRGKLHGSLITYKNGEKEKTIHYRKGKVKEPFLKRLKKNNDETEEIPTKSK